MRIAPADYEDIFLDGDEDCFEKFSHKTKLVKKEKQNIIKQKRKAKMKERKRLTETKKEQ